MAAQDPPRIVFSEEVSVNWITVPVAVEEAEPDPTPLDRADFELRVDGMPVDIESFDGDAAPFGLLYAQDLSGSMALSSKLALSRQALALLQATAGELDEMAIVTFASAQTRIQVPFTTDPALLEDASRHWTGYGTTALYDTLAALTDVAAESHRSRRAVVLVTDGVDNASTVAPENARALLTGAGLPVFVLDLSPLFESMPAVGSQDQRTDLTLAELALATGGRHLHLGDHAAVQDAILRITRDLRQEYLLGFTTNDGEEGWHRLEVTLPTRGAAQLRYRTRYYGALPSSASSRPAPATAAEDSRLKKRSTP